VVLGPARCEQRAAASACQALRQLLVGLVLGVILTQKIQCGRCAAYS